ncbi:glycosyltransferase family protein [Lachnospiraceae bacterium C1.1]|nr:glycosyltransferase family protein [Lachnospiraceae bacterium C1.1]
MKINEIAFIVCYNDEFLMGECKKYIERLYLPESYSIDIITVAEAPSMCAGYNAAMKSSDAWIKVYLHQDTFIVNRYFIFNIVEIFNSDKNIGIIGITGTDALPDSAIWWRGEVKGKFPFTKEEYIDERIGENYNLSEAVAVDGFLIATSKNVEWREDIFDGFDFYDISQCLEYRRRGYRVVVAEQRLPWCIHADGFFLDLDNYAYARKIFFEEYKKEEYYLNDSHVLMNDSMEIEALLRDYKLKKEKFDRYQTIFLGEISDALKNNEYEKIMSLYVESASNITENEGMLMAIPADYLRFMVIMDAYQKESMAGIRLFLANTESFSELMGKFRKVEIYLRRLEYDFDNDAYNETFDFIHNENISQYAISEIMNSAVAQLGNLDRIKKIIKERTGYDCNIICE